MRVQSLFSFFLQRVVVIFEIAIVTLFLGAVPVSAQITKCTATDTCVSACPSGTLTRGPCKGSTAANPLVCCTAPSAATCTGACESGTSCNGTDTPILGQTCDSNNGQVFTCCKVAPSTGGASTPEVNAMCFTQDQCSSPKYGGSPDRFVPGMGCPGAMGYCLAPEPTIVMSTSILGNVAVKGLGSYISLMFKYLLGVVTIVALIMFVYGGFKYVVHSSISEIQDGKEKIVNATVGLLLVFGCILLLRTINPATTNLNTLKVYLVNAQEFVQLNFCSELPTDSAKKFLYAGNPPGSAAFDPDPKKYTLGPGDTACGSSYYIQGTSGQTCRGLKCDPDTLCLPKGETAMACQKATFGGNISWAQGSYPVEVFLFAVCADSTPDKPHIDTTDVLPMSPMTKPSGDSGSTGYVFDLKMDLMKKWSDFCGSHINGVLIGMQYHDACSVIGAAMNSSGAGSAAYNAAACAASPDDWLILSKNDCQGATQGTNQTSLAFQNNYFSGYVTTPASSNSWLKVAKWTAAVVLTPVTFGGSLAAAAAIGDSESSLIEKAFYCGYEVNPGGDWASKGQTTGRFDWVKDTGSGSGLGSPASPYWDWEDMNTAVNGHKPIMCNINLNGKNAPPNPSTALMKGCGDTVDTNPNQ